MFKDKYQMVAIIGCLTNITAKSAQNWTVTIIPSTFSVNNIVFKILKS